MGDISQHFSRSEFKCPCCDFDTVDVQLVALLEKIRTDFDSPITINSGCRCKNHNDIVGGTKNSQHLLGRAADIVVKDTHPQVIQSYFDDKHPDLYGMGRYNTFTHIDTRGRKVRW